MKFKYGQNHTVVQTMKSKQTGKVLKRFVVCKFDENGELETNDPMLIHILKTKLPGCTWDESDPENITVKPEEVREILSDDEIRQLAKEKGVKSWHLKGIDKLKEELKKKFKELEV